MPKNKQSDLPGMEDRRIEDLHTKALKYVSIRDSRMELTEQESGLKQELLDLMKKHKKEKYVCEGVEIMCVHEEETVKVKVHRSKEEKEDAA